MGIFSRRRETVLGNPNAAGMPNSLTASGFKVSRRDADMMRRLVQPWQTRAFMYYDSLGEIKYASQFYARMLSPLRLYAAEIDKDNDVVETDNPEAIAALERIQDPGGGRVGLLGAYGRLMFLTGEAYLFVTTDPDTGQEQWEMLSSDELRIQSGIYIRYKAPSLAAEEYREPTDPDSSETAWVPVDDNTAVAYRLWQRHPRYSMLADSTMMGVLELCEELLLLTHAVRARARSRLAGSGILLIDERISPPPLEPIPDEDPASDPLISALVNAMTLPIVNEGAASQIVPLTLRVPVADNAKVADMIHHLQIIDPTQLYPETGLRYECIKRIAIGLDMPPEILLGLEEANHWTAWQIDEQTWKGHGAPKAVQLCDDLTSSYFRPYLRDVVGLPDWDKYLISFDATDIINHPDRTSDAKDLFDRVVIGKKALREAAGFDEEDAPTEEERAERLGILTRDSSLAWFGEPAPRGGAVETAPGEIVSDQAGPDGSAPTSGSKPPGQGSTGSSAEKGPPPAKDAPATDDTVIGSGATAETVARLMAASDIAVLRVREAAGSRLRSLAKKDPDMVSLIDGVKNGSVAATLGKERVHQLRISEADLVSAARDLVKDSIRMWRIDEKVAEIVAQNVEKHAARTLYDEKPTPFPATFAAYLQGLLG